MKYYTLKLDHPKLWKEIKTYSEFNFNPSYSENLSNLKILAYPVLSLLVNSFFYKIFGSYSFILLEFFMSTSPSSEKSS